MKTKLLFGFCLLIALVGCEQKSIHRGSDELRWIDDLSIGVEETDGYYYLSSAMIMYYDFSTDKSVIVCTKPGCSHQRTRMDTPEEQICHASISDVQGLKLVPTDQSIFLFEMAGFERGEGKTKIVRSDKDRSNQRVVTYFQGSAVDQMMKVGDQLYFTSVEPEVKAMDDGTLQMSSLSKSTVYRFDLTTEKLTPLYETDKQIGLSEQLIGIDQDDIYVKRQFLTEPITNREQSVPAVTEIWRWNEKEDLRRVAVDFNPTDSVITMEDGFLFILTRNDPKREQMNLELLSLLDGGREILLTDITSVNYSQDGFFYQKDNQSHFYDIKDKTDRMVELPPGPSFVYGVVGNQYLISIQKDEQYRFALIDKEDYRGGKDRYRLLEAYDGD